MEAIRESEQPRLKADVDSLKRALERVYQNVQATQSERREPMTPALSSVGMVTAPWVDGTNRPQSFARPRNTVRGGG